MERTLWIGLWGLVLCSSIVNGVPYSKYGRGCGDINCLSNQHCELEYEPCTYNKPQGQCGQYPTCKRNADAGTESCQSKRCEAGQYCKTIDGRPTCVNSNSNLGFESAGVSSVNGHRTDPDRNPVPPITNHNPYEHANAPPVDPSHDTNYHPINSQNNYGYPAYPSTPGNSGYQPRPPSSGTNLGYPTQNRMPQPYQPGYPPSGHYPPNNYPGYPPNQPAGYPYGNYPHNQNPYNSNSKKYRGAAASNSPEILSFCFVVLLRMLNGYLS